MTNNTTKQNENQELSNYQKLLKSLDDDKTARIFRAKQLEIAKEIIGDILSVTTGNNIITVANNEWGHGNLLHFVSIFQTKHTNFYLPDFAEDLKDYIYTWTFDYTESNRNWQKKHFTERNLDEYGTPLEMPTEPADISDEPENETQTTQPKVATLAEHTLQIMANKISHILGSDKVPDDVKEAFRSIAFEAGNESGIGGTTHPELIKTAFLLAIKSLDDNYGRGIILSLRSLLDSGLVDSIEDELRQYEKRFDGRTEDELRILDLSNSSIEDLARTLSGIMHNPNLPKTIYDCLADNLSVNHTDVYTPENILGNLKEKLQKEN